MNYKTIALLLILSSQISLLNANSRGCEIVILDSTFSNTKILSYDMQQNIKPFAGLVDMYYKRFKIPTLQGVRLISAVEKAINGLQKDIAGILNSNPKERSIHIALGFNLSPDKQGTSQALQQKYPTQVLNKMIERCNFYKNQVYEALQKNDVAKNIREYYNTNNVYVAVKIDNDFNTLFCFPLQ